jgi:hypothetical protein
MQLARHYDYRRFVTESDGNTCFFKLGQEKLTNVTTDGGRDM